jgi:tRNA1Val (adenine37-N6)-methyltransferase
MKINYIRFWFYNIMPNKHFQFKQFTVVQDRCAMKVGTDGVLLGAWTKIEGAKKILDIGTGTGLIALMLAQRSEAVIDGLEIDPSASKQADENIKNSPWHNRINIICGSFQNFSKLNKQYDLIISNPPFFSNSLSAPDLLRTMARHNHNLSPAELFEGVVSLLHPKGKFCIIWPFAEYNLLSSFATEAGLFENRITRVFPTPGKPAKRIMIEFSFSETAIAETDLIIENHGRHKYSDYYINLTKDYYLKF